MSWSRWFGFVVKAALVLGGAWVGAWAGARFEPLWLWVGAGAGAGVVLAGLYEFLIERRDPSSCHYPGGDDDCAKPTRGP